MMRYPSCVSIVHVELQRVEDAVFGPLHAFGIFVPVIVVAEKMQCTVHEVQRQLGGYRMTMFVGTSLRTLDVDHDLTLRVLIAVRGHLLPEQREAHHVGRGWITEEAAVQLRERRVVYQGYDDGKLRAAAVSEGARDRSRDVRVRERTPRHAPAHLDLRVAGGHGPDLAARR